MEFFLYKDTAMISPGVIHEVLNEGKDIFFTFQATGNPIPTISWYFNGAPVDIGNTMKYMISEIEFNPNTKNSTIMIMNVELSDMGTYTCDATNLVSSSTSYGELTVIGKIFTVVMLHCKQTYELLTL